MTEKMRPLLLVGAGGFGRETVEVVRAINDRAPTWDLLGFLDDRPALRGGSLDDVDVLGPTAAVADRPDAMVALCTGSPRDFSSRRRIARRLDLPPQRYATIVHPAASIARSARIAPGCVLLANVVVTAAATIGMHCAVMPHVVITHDDVIEPYVTIAAGARLGGGVTVRTGAYLGAGCSVREGCTIGAGALIGLGAAVVTDVPAGQVWAGVPARRVRDVAPSATPGAPRADGARAQAGAGADRTA